MPSEHSLTGAERAVLDAVAPGCVARRQPAGRSNTVFRVETRAGLLALKIYGDDTATPLFANRPGDEARALVALSGTGLAPQLVDRGRIRGREWVLYRWVGAGTLPHPSPASVGTALSRLHGTRPPDLPRMTSELAETQAEEMLAALAGPQRKRLASRRVAPPVLAGNAFLHGDPVPGNLVASQDGVRLIDWQCPAVGDPVFDIALYLSPAMQLVHGGRILSEAERRGFFAAYGDPAAKGRWAEAAPFMAWRMALYCAWRAERGDAAYRPGIAVELGL